MIRKALTILVVSMIALVIGQSAALAAIPDTTYLRVWPEYSDNQVLFLEAIQLSPVTVLPVEVKAAIPKGASIVWVGEILPQGDPSQDPEAAYKINPKDDYDEVVFTLTKSRMGQIEARWNGLKIDGANRVLNLDWTQHYESKQVIFELREPSAASDIKLTPPAATLDTAPDGAKFHQTAPLSLAVGQKQNFQVTYKRSTNTPTASEQSGVQQQGAGAQSTPQSNSIASLIVVAIVVGVIVFAIYWSKTRSAGSPNSSKQRNSLGMMLFIAALVVFIGIIGYGITNTAIKTSGGIPSGNNCGENIAYLQAGVDKYKEAFGVYPASLNQLLESKDGKGPFVETINLQCPTDNSPYAVIDGVVQQVASQ